MTLGRVQYRPGNIKGNLLINSPTYNVLRIFRQCEHQKKKIKYL